MSKFLNYYCFMALVLCYTAGKFDYYLCFCVKFLNRRFGSLFWLPRVPIGSLFHKKLGPYFSARRSLKVQCNCSNCLWAASALEAALAKLSLNSSSQATSAHIQRPSVSAPRSTPSLSTPAPTSASLPGIMLFTKNYQISEIMTSVYQRCSILWNMKNHLWHFTWIHIFQNHCMIFTIGT